MSAIDELRRGTDRAVVIANHQGIITEVNAAFETLFGWRSSDIVGQPLTAIIPHTMHDAHHLGFSRFLMTGKETLMNRPLHLKAVTKDGREFDAEHVIVAEQENGQWMFGATIRAV